MLERERQLLLTNRTQELRETLAAGRMPDSSALQAYLALVESAAVDAHVVSDEHDGFKQYHESTEAALASLSALGSFEAQELMPDQWVLERQGRVIASGPSLLEAMQDMLTPSRSVKDIVSVQCVAMQ